jgi:hypothetical protein
MPKAHFLSFLNYINFDFAFLENYIFKNWKNI